MPMRPWLDRLAIRWAQPLRQSIRMATAAEQVAKMFAPFCGQHAVETYVDDCREQDRLRDRRKWERLALALLPVVLFPLGLHGWVSVVAMWTWIVLWNMFGFWQMEAWHMVQHAHARMLALQAMTRTAQADGAQAACRLFNLLAFEKPNCTRWPHE